MRFEFDTLFDEPELPERPAYVHESEIGIVHSSVEAVVSKVPRGGMYFIVYNTSHVLSFVGVVLYTLNSSMEKCNCYF